MANAEQIRVYLAIDRELAARFSVACRETLFLRKEFMVVKEHYPEQEYTNVGSENESSRSRHSCLTIEKQQSNCESFKIHPEIVDKVKRCLS